MDKKVFDDHMVHCKNLFVTHQYDQGIISLERGLILYKENMLAFDFPNILEGLHISYKSINDHEQYNKTLLSVIDMLEARNQYETMVGYMLYLAGEWLQLGHEARGIDLIHKGMKSVGGLANPCLNFKLMNALGNYYFGQKAYEMAKSYYELVYDQARDIDHASTGKAAHNLGNTYKELGDYQEALTYLHKGESYFLTTPDKSSHSNAFCDIGNAYRCMGAYRQAQVYFDKAFAIADSLGLKSQLVDIAYERKILFEVQNKYQEAYKYQEEYYERLRHQDTNLAKYQVEMAIHTYDIDHLKQALTTEGEKNNHLNHLLEDLQSSQGLLQTAVQESERVQVKLMSKNKELSHAYEHLIEVQEKLIRSEKSTALNRLIIKVAHELNTPLGNIQLILDYFYQRLSRAFEEEDMTARQRGILNASKTIYDRFDILDASLKSAVKFIETLQTSVVDFNSSHNHEVNLFLFFKHMIHEVQGKYELACDFECSIAEDLLVKVSTKILRTVVVNLLDNAFIHAFGGQESPKIKIEVEKKEKLIICISDNGRGIAPNLRASIFEPFKMKSLNEDGALGHGLFVVKSLVDDLLGGTIELNDRSEGSSYTISI